MWVPRLDDFAVVGWGDAAWAARPSGESQGGEFVCLAPRDFLGGHRREIQPASWKSCELPRVVRSSTSAEVQAQSEVLGEVLPVRLIVSVYPQRKGELPRHRGGG